MKRQQNFWVSFSSLQNLSQHPKRTLKNQVMSKNQLNPIPITQNYLQKQTGTQEIMQISKQVGQFGAQESKGQNQEGEMELSQKNHENRYETLEVYQEQMNDNFDEDKRILLENEEGQNHSNGSYSNYYQNEVEFQRKGQQKAPNPSFLEESYQNNGQNERTEEVQIKILDDGYNYETQQAFQVQNENNQYQPEDGMQQISQKVKYLRNSPQNSQQSIMHPPNNIQSSITPQRAYNSYVQAILNTPINPSTQPSHQALQQIYIILKQKFPQCLPEQIILLLYNNLIKIPREEMLQQQGQKFDDSLKYDGGKKYFQELTSLNNNNRLEMVNYEVRRQMIKVYVNKGYGLKVYQEHMMSINPNAVPIDKDKFKSHFVAIYKVVFKKVEEFLYHTADRQFQPATKNEFNKTLGDVINCRKHYTPEFCEVFFRIIESTFNTDFDVNKLPTEGEVAFFYRTVLSKVREHKVTLVKKMHLQEQEKDTDIWSEEFQFYFLKQYILFKNIAEAKVKLIENYPECESLLTDQKLKQKVENAIRVATRLLQIENQHCGNPVQFTPSDIDRQFIMKAPELEQSRIKLLKVYIKRPKDPQVLNEIVKFVKRQLMNKYEKQRIPPQVLQRSTVHQFSRNQEEAQLEKIIRDQIMRKA